MEVAEVSFIVLSMNLGSDILSRSTSELQCAQKLLLPPMAHSTHSLVYISVAHCHLAFISPTVPKALFYPLTILISEDKDNILGYFAPQEPTAWSRGFW